MQERRFQPVLERLGNQEAVCVISASFCACALTGDSQYGNGHKECSLYETSQLASSRLPHVELQQNKTCTEDHLVDWSRVALVAARKISISEEIYASYRRTDFLGSVELEYM